eukprot:scaffold10016_cov54-Attheya_sp.AAC.1
MHQDIDIILARDGWLSSLSQKTIYYNRDEDTIVQDLFQKVLDNTAKITPEAVASVSKEKSVILLQNLQSLVAAFYALPLYMEVVAVVVPVAGLLAFVLYSLSHPKQDFRSGYEPYQRGEYDPIAAKAYYKQHPVLILQRATQLLRIGNKFIVDVWVDKNVWKDEEMQRPLRAQQLLELVQQAGPTAIKVGQALSVRPDLIPVEYAEALATLQDRVPPFDSSRARQILRQELGNKMDALKDLGMKDSQGPVASASIGQVYRGMAVCDDGVTREVAVKIQRPDVLAEIALDLYLVREFAPLYQRLTGSATNFQSLANEWGRGFIAELDYHEEAKNTQQFNREMKKRAITAVIAPEVVGEFTADRVLVTKWVDGTRLDQSTASDVPQLCTAALNAYLVMLLELQKLHCDPHPGNLLRTKDGKLCILDWGMTLETDPSLQYSLLEFVAHLTSETYGEIPNDLVKIGFLKEERLETVRASGFLEPLTFMLRQAGKGGGATKVRERIFDEFREKYPGVADDELRIKMRADMKADIEEARRKESAISGITMEVEELQKRNADAFRIPEWFLYTSRAFLTLEGICLSVDENYSIIQSCFPYVAKRLVGDDSPRAQMALRDLIYGASDVIDVDRLSDLAEGFSSYTTSTKTINQQTTSSKESDEETLETNGAPKKKSDQKRKSRKEKLAKTEASITLAKDSADVLLSRDGNFLQTLLINEGVLATSAQLKDALKDAVIDSPKRLRQSIPFNLGSLLLPELPLESGAAPFFKKTPEEAKAQFTSTLLERASSSIDETLTDIEGREGEPSDRFVKSAARGISNIAGQGADAIRKRNQTNNPK